MTDIHKKKGGKPHKSGKPSQPSKSGKSGGGAARPTAPKKPVHPARAVKPAPSPEGAADPEELMDDDLGPDAEESGDDLSPEIDGVSARQLYQLMESMGGFRGVLDSLKPPENPELDEAQKLVYEAWDAPSPAKAAALARRAIEVCADCGDAYAILADLSESDAEALQHLKDGVEAAKRALGASFESHVGHFWELLETRPYFRVRSMLADELWSQGHKEEAIEHYRELLKLDKSDHQGLRDILLPRLLELGLDAEARDLWKAFHEDASASWLYGKALLEFKKQANSEAAQKALAEALESNVYMPEYLTEKTEMPEEVPEFYGMGDRNEAIIFGDFSMDAWKATPQALDWLAAAAAARPVAKGKAQRPAKKGPRKKA